MRHSLIGLVIFAACDKGAKAPPPAPVAVVRHVPRATTPPPSLPRLPQTVVAWAAAEAARSPRAWVSAADAYERELDGCLATGATSGCAEDAYAVVLARKAAIGDDEKTPPPGTDPAPVPADVQETIDAMDRYSGLAEPGDVDAAGMRFLAGNMLNRYRQPEGIARLENVIHEDRNFEFAEYAANILLDALIRAGKTDEARALVTELLADSAFLAAHPDLRATLEQLRAALAG